MPMRRELLECFSKDAKQLFQVACACLVQWYNTACMCLSKESLITHWIFSSTECYRSSNLCMRFDISEFTIKALLHLTTWTSHMKWWQPKNIRTRKSNRTVAQLGWGPAPPNVHCAPATTCLPKYTYIFLFSNCIQSTVGSRPQWGGFLAMPL